jgi:predicted GNAT family acetyltransferase
LKEVMAEASAAGKPVRIYVERFNRALRLYERLGFRTIGDTGVYYHMEWRPPGCPTG